MNPMEIYENGLQIINLIKLKNLKIPFNLFVKDYVITLIL